MPGCLAVTYYVLLYSAVSLQQLPEIPKYCGTSGKHFTIVAALAARGWVDCCGQLIDAVYL